VEDSDHCLVRTEKFSNSKGAKKKKVAGKDPTSSLSMTAIQPLVSACYEPQETLDASPYFTLPSTAELHGMLEPDNAGRCHIDHQTWDPW
jgi:hypothetical protein